MCHIWMLARVFFILWGGEQKKGIPEKEFLKRKVATDKHPSCDNDGDLFCFGFRRPVSQHRSISMDDRPDMFALQRPGKIPRLQTVNDLYPVDDFTVLEDFQAGALDDQVVQVHCH
jgi:hypothetical protein